MTHREIIRQRLPIVRIPVELHRAFQWHHHFRYYPPMPFVISINKHVYLREKPITTRDTTRLLLEPAVIPTTTVPLVIRTASIDRRRRTGRRARVNAVPERCLTIPAGRHSNDR